ncbi:MAG: hypothetical protein ACK559_29670, partial [bacterium]
MHIDGKSRAARRLMCEAGGRLFFVSSSGLNFFANQLRSAFSSFYSKRNLAAELPDDRFSPCEAAT